MNRLEDAYEKFLIAIASRSSERSILLIASLVYAGVGLALPLLLGWSVPWLIAANVVATSFAFSVLMLWIAQQVQASRRRNLVEWTTDLRRLNGAEFEWLVGELFRREGWKVEERGRQDGPDGGIDLVLMRGSQRAIVQCKRWTSWQVGVEDVRGFAGALTRDGLRATAGIFVTLSDYTGQARLEAQQLGLTLLDGVDLFARVEKVRRAEPCPKCGDPMILSRSPYGWWFRCRRQGCVGKRDLDRDPAQAVELLTRPPA